MLAHIDTSQLSNPWNLKLGKRGGSWHRDSNGAVAALRAQCSVLRAHRARAGRPDSGAQTGELPGLLGDFTGTGATGLVTVFAWRFAGRRPVLPETEQRADGFSSVIEKANILSF